MRIDTPMTSPTEVLKARKTTGKNESFQEALKAQASARKTGDSITIYSQGQTANATATAPALTILPTDSTDIKLAKLEAIAKEADYTGMSYGEINKAIWDRYNDAFDGNMFAILTFAGGDWWKINNQYGSEVAQAVEHPIFREVTAETGLQRHDPGFGERARAILRDVRSEAFGYSGMSFEEIESTIREKYNGKETFVDFLNMQGELYYTGAMGDKMGSREASAYMDALRSQVDFSYNSSNGTGAYVHLTQEEVDSLLHTKFNANGFAHEFRETLSHSAFSGFTFDIEKAISAGINNYIATWDQHWDKQPEPAVQRMSATEAAQLSATKTSATAPALTILPTDSTDIKLAKLEAIAKEADYTGMSYADIYKAIWNRYNDAFDGNLEAIGISGGKEWGAANVQFQNEVKCVVTLPAKAEVRAETGLRYDAPELPALVLEKLGGENLRAAALGYGGMDYDEMEAAIFGKYKDKGTVADFLNMQGELFHTGVMSNKLGEDRFFHYLSFMKLGLERTYNYESYVTGKGSMTQEEYDAILYTKFIPEEFVSNLKDTLTRYTSSGFPYDPEVVITSGINKYIEVPCAEWDSSMDQDGFLRDAKRAMVERMLAEEGKDTEREFNVDEILYAPLDDYIEALGHHWDRQHEAAAQRRREAAKEQDAQDVQQSAALHES